MSITNQRLIRLPEVLQRVGVSRSTLYCWIKRGQFPRQIALGANSSAWIEADVNAWIAARIAARAQVTV